MLLEKKISWYYLLNKVKYDMLYVLIIGLATHYLTTRFTNVLPEMPLTIPAFLGTAISILLSFKISQSYDRWWEARKVWGAIVNDSRSLIIQLQSMLFVANSEQIIKVVAYRQIGWCYALGQSLRGQNPLENLEVYFSTEEISKLSSHTNKPLAILQLNALHLSTLRKGNEIDGFAHIQVDNTLTRLCDAMGKAERINNTVFPTTYRLLLHISIYLFVITLSIALQGIPFLYEAPLLLGISWMFFMLEKSATHMQDPFRNRPTDIAVTAIARTIEINIKQLLSEDKIPPFVEPNSFYVL